VIILFYDILLKRDREMPMADIDKCPPELRNDLLAELVTEVREMSDREIGFLMLEAMDDDEMQSRIEELGNGAPFSSTVH
jgi:hypothetical protein